MPRLLVVLAPNLAAAHTTARRLTGAEILDSVEVGRAARQDVIAWLELLRKEFRTRPSERPSRLFPLRDKISRAPPGGR